PRRRDAPPDRPAADGGLFRSGDRGAARMRPADRRSQARADPQDLAAGGGAVTDDVLASTPRSLPLTLAGQIDRACDRFEDDWKAGRRPRIEAYLADAAEPDRPVLLRELLLLELEFRRVHGERPSPGEYQDRFP